MVAPHAGAWIEISNLNPWEKLIRSPLTQGRGLKLTEDCPQRNLPVAPHAGAWIEI